MVLELLLSTSSTPELTPFCVALGLNTANISGIMSMKPFTKHFGLDSMSTTTASNLKAWITACLLLGSCAGALIASPISERVGRRISLQIFSLFYIISAILMTVGPRGSGGLAMLITGRVISGASSGAASVIGTAYIAEISPKIIRGGLSALYNANTMFGVSLGYWINYGALLNISSLSNAQWQVPMAMQVLPGIILFFGLIVMPESPRWLASKGRVEEARNSLKSLRQLDLDHIFLREELSEIIETRLYVAEQTKGFNLTRFREVPNLGKRLILVCLVQLFFQFSGGNVITYYNTTILDAIGFTDPKTNFLFSGIYGFVKVVSVLLYCLYFVDSYGRRPLLWAGSCIIIVTLTYMSIYLGALINTSGGTAAGWAAIVAIYLFAIGYAISWATVPWIINAEVFPMSVRTPCMALMITWQYLVNFGLTRGMSNMLTSMHTYGPFALFACATAVGTTYCYFAFPETKGMSISHVDLLFEVPWYKVGRHSLKVVRDEAHRDIEDDSATRASKLAKGDHETQHLERP